MLCVEHHSRFRIYERLHACVQFQLFCWEQKIHSLIERTDIAFFPTTKLHILLDKFARCGIDERKNVYTSSCTMLKILTICGWSKLLDFISI